MIVPAPADTVQVVRTVFGFTDFLLRYVGALAAVGAFAMALMEAVKKLLDSRTKFHAKRFTRWIMKAAGSPIEARRFPAAGEQGRNSALGSIILLCTGVSRGEAMSAADQLIRTQGTLPLFLARDRDPAVALFALDLDRMMGSVQEAADVVLASPTAHRELYDFLVAGADADDAERWVAQASDPVPVPVVTANAPPEQERAIQAQQRQDVKDTTERYARLRQAVKRKLDGFQLYTADHWTSYNQFAANCTGAVVLYAALVAPDVAAASNANGDVLRAMWAGPGVLIIALLGGIFSPVAKDLVMALKRVKDG